MKQETITTGRTVAAALEAAVQYFGVPADKITYEILAEPKKGFLGFGEAPAKIRAVYEQTPADLGLAFLKKLIDDMELNATLTMSDTENGKLIDVRGEDATVLIGHHGETLDQLQYLVNLAANKKENEEDDRSYTRIVVDIEGYRAKREETLRALARRMSSKVLRTRKSVSLEPMSAYERRIIHSEVHKIAGVTTVSIGAENNRRVVIHVDDESAEIAE
ncbi:MAG: RNA-binding cell elongation regulator Jag/EloR [Eubacteriales bacterium]